MIAVLASLLPTLDPVTLLLEMAPLVALYELSIWLATIFTPARRRPARSGCLGRGLADLLAFAPMLFDLQGKRKTWSR